MYIYIYIVLYIYIHDLFCRSMAISCRFTPRSLRFSRHRWVLPTMIHEDIPNVKDEHKMRIYHADVR